MRRGRIWASSLPGRWRFFRGSNFKGSDVSVTFDGTAGTMTANDGQSITVQLPVSLKYGSRPQAQVSVDGVKKRYTGNSYFRVRAGDLLERRSQ